MTASLPAGDHTPSLWRTRRRDTPLEAFTGAGWPLFHEMGQPTFALVVGSPSERTNHLGGWDGFLKLEKSMDFCYFSSGDCGTSGSCVCGWVGGLAWTGIWVLKRGFCWHWGRGVFSWCRLPSVCYICSKPPLVNGCYRDMNCSRMGHFGLAVQHLGGARGWGFCWGGATAASLWNVLILSPTRPPAPTSPFSVSLTLPSTSCFYPPNFTSPLGVLAPSTFEKKWCFLWFF